MGFSRFVKIHLNIRFSTEIGPKLGISTVRSFICQPTSFENSPKNARSHFQGISDQKSCFFYEVRHVAIHPHICASWPEALDVFFVRFFQKHLKSLISADLNRFQFSGQLRTRSSAPEKGKVFCVTWCHATRFLSRSLVVFKHRICHTKKRTCVPQAHF